MERHTASQGDCFHSVAERYGFFWETLWMHPENAELRVARKDPHTLLPGDVVVIPDKTPPEYDCATTKRHTFRVRNVPAKLNVVLRWAGKPRANEPFELDIDGEVSQGTTDGDGRVVHSIHPTARQAVLTIGEGARRKVYRMRLGGLDPIDTLTGVKARLRNLGYPCGEFDERQGREFRQVLLPFQADHADVLKATGELDGATRQKILEEHRG